MNNDFFYACCGVLYCDNRIFTAPHYASQSQAYDNDAVFRSKDLNEIYEFALKL